MQHNSYRRWITLAIISFSGGVSFDLAYLRYIYQIPMAKFMGFSNTEITWKAEVLCESNHASAFLNYLTIRTSHCDYDHISSYVLMLKIISSYQR